jgi:hypothetical protein
MKRIKIKNTKPTKEDLDNWTKESRIINLPDYIIKKIEEIEKTSREYIKNKNENN